MAELRAGGLALVIRSDDPYDLGKTVKLIELISTGKSAKAPSGELYSMKNGVISWAVEGDVRVIGVRQETLIHGWAMFEPMQLMPLSDGGFSHEDEQQKELTHG